MQQASKKQIVIVFLTVLIDMFALGLIIPILTPLIVKPTSPLYSPSVLGILTPKIVFGIVAASYSIAQFFTAPILGSLSDKYGRKKVLMICIAGTAAGYATTALGILTEQIFLVGFGHFLHGVFAGTIAIAYSTLADMSDEVSKSKNFALVGAAFGLGFIFGPPLGGFLANPERVPWFSYLVPFVCSAGISCVNILFVWRFFPKLHSANASITASAHSEQAEVSPWNFLENFRNVRRAFALEHFRGIFIVAFVAACGFTFFTQFIQLYLIDTFQFSQSEIGRLFGWLGLWLVIAQGGIIRWVSKKFSFARTYVAVQVLLAFAVLALLIPTNSNYLYVVIPFVAIAQGISTPTLAAIISNRASRHNQGKIIGINQSMEAMAQSVVPLIGGVLATLHVSLPLLCASLVGALVVALFARQQR